MSSELSEHQGELESDFQKEAISSGLRPIGSSLSPSPPHPQKESRQASGRSGLGLKAKLLLWFLPLVNLILLGIWFVSTTTARAGLMELSSRNLSTASHDLASALADALSDAYADARTTAALDLPAQAIETGDAKNMTWYANELVKTKSKYVAIVVTDLDGKIVSANTLDNQGTTISQALLGQSITKSPWLTASMASKKGEGTLVPPGRPDFMLPLLGEQARVVGFSMPVFDIMDDAVGSVTVFVSMKFLAKRLSGLTHIKNGRPDSLAAIVQGDGSLIALPPSLSASSQQWQDSRWPSPNPSEPVVRWPGPEQVSFFLSQNEINAGVSALDWRLATLRTVAAVEAPVSAMGRQLLWASLFAVLAATLAIALVAGKFVGPISRLTETIASTGKAADFKPVAIETKDEIGVLAVAFNRMFQTIVDHEQNLERRVEERTAQLALAKREVSDILDNMQQGVFTMSEGCTVDPQYSAYSQELFGDVTIAGSDLMTLLQMSEEACGQEAYSRMHCWVETVIGSDDFQWMLSEDEGIRRIVYSRQQDENTERRVIELEYAPIYVNEVVSKVMVLARDVTALEALKNEVELKDQENQDNIDRVAELNNLDAELFETFISESEILLVECRRAIAGLQTSGGDQGCIDQLFRAMHTLKGNSRIFKITRVQDKAHAVENQFEKYRESNAALTPDQIAEVEASVESVTKELGSFEALGRRVLLGEKKGERSTQVGAFEYVDRTLQEFPDLSLTLQASESDSGEALVKLRGKVQEILEESYRLGLSSLAKPASATIELLEYNQPLRSAVDQFLQNLEDAFASSRKLAADLKGSANSENFLMEATRLLSSLMRTLSQWDRDVNNVAHVHALLRQLDTLLGVSAADKIATIQERGATMVDLLSEVRDAGAEALVPSTILEVRNRLESLRTLLEDGQAYVGYQPAFRGALVAFRRMALGLEHQFLTWDRGTQSSDTSRAVYQRAYDCRIELQERGLTWLAEEARRLESTLFSLNDQSSELPVSSRSAVRAEQEFVKFLSNYRLLHTVGIELRSRKNPTRLVHELFRLATVAESRRSSKTGIEFATLREAVRKSRLPSIQQLIAFNDPTALRQCALLLGDVKVLVDLNRSEQSGESQAVRKVPEEQIQALTGACSQLSPLLSEERFSNEPTLHRSIQAVQFHTWALTARPVGPLFSRMRKMVFALGVELDKGVEELRFDGGEILVETDIIDKLRDILIHTLRNSIDHGIETRQIRESLGKPSRGKITVHCSETDNLVTVEVTDDGAGIDLSAVKSKALSKGLRTEEELSALDEKSALALIFLPGFSTNTEVTDVSGRGVGMDVVKCSIESLSGTIELSSSLGHGTTTQIKFPAQRAS